MPEHAIHYRKKRVARKGSNRDKQAPTWSLNRPRAKASARAVGLALLLVVGTLLVYSSLRSHEFINYDDDEYVLNNEHVTSGLSWQTARWALTSTEQANWHPVTWLSHALDCQLFGLDAGSHHLTSLLIHTLNVVLLFLLLWKATGAIGRSFVVAGLFAWHPFNVESVAWVAERKNLLSTLFFLLAMGAYGWYARRPGLRRYFVVAVMFVLALASKPMAVSLPFVLLLLDYWPLMRVEGCVEPSLQFPAPQQPVRQLLLEKIPLFALAGASSVITIYAQTTRGAVQSMELYPLGARLANALNSYRLYIWKSLWPSGFALLYPHPGASLPFWKPMVAILLLFAIGVGVWTQRRTRPWLVSGWLWFLGILVPVIGIVQVGDQAMADRYAYLPIAGLLVVAVWGIASLTDKWITPFPAARWAFALVPLAAISFLTIRQLEYWQNSTTVWAHTLEVTGENVHSEKELANAMIRQGDTAAALPRLMTLARIAPNDVWTHANMGASYASQHRIKDANHEFEMVVRLTDRETLDPMDRRFRSTAQLNLGFGYLVSKDYANALANFEAANRSDPAMVEHAIENFDRSLATAQSEGDLLRLSLLLRAKGENRRASDILQQAIDANPEYANACDLLRDFDHGPQ